MKPLVRRFAELIGDDLAAAGFVRRGPVFRLVDAEGNGIVLDIQGTTALTGEVAFFVNVGVLLAAPVRHVLAGGDPRRDAMPHHGVWRHRLVAGTTMGLPDHTFSLSTPADAVDAATIVRAWLAANLPRLTSWLGDAEAMLAALAEDRVRSAQARAEQLASGRWQPGRWPDGVWSDGVIRAYAAAERGDVDAVAAETAHWSDQGPDSGAAHAMARAHQRRTEREG